MPGTRKSSRLSGGPATKQSTLSFNHRVTKNVAKSAKDSALLPSEAPPTDELSQPKKLKEVVEAPQVEDAEKEVVGDEEEEEEEEEKEKEEEVPKLEEPKPTVAKLDVELEAEKIGDEGVERYWRKLEAERVAKRQHQEGLPTGEKVLRYFDVSSQYGPCMGITRAKRWHRARRLGLDPPLEVLTVILKEEAEVKGSSERAHLDELMNSTAIGAA